jgi:hypothetical protein
MPRDRTGLALLLAAALGAVPMGVADGAPRCHSRLLNVEHPVRADATAGSLWLQGGPTAVRVEACQSTIAAVLSALSAYGISYRSSVALEEARNGTYAGSPGQVIARVLDGYSYVMRHDSSHIDIIIYGKRGESAVAAPIAAQVSQNSERLPHQASRNR